MCASFPQCLIQEARKLLLIRAVGNRPLNALVQLQAHYHHRGEPQSEKCLSAATLARQQAPEPLWTRLAFAAAGNRVLPVSIGHQVVLLFLFAIPVACVSWTVTHEDLFRELREWLTARSNASRNILSRKFFYLFTCEYCFSHYIAIGMLFLTRFTLVFEDWRGYLIAGFSIVWIANLYMSLFGRLRLAITSERQDIEVAEKMVNKGEDDAGAKG
jgi:hypothetical protein